MHSILKTQAAFDEVFIKVMCTSFVLCSTTPSVDRKNPPQSPSQKKLNGRSKSEQDKIIAKYERHLAEHDNFTVTWNESCNHAARCIHSMSQDFG
jgi:hypothetical protein